MVDASDDFQINEVFGQAPVTDDDRAKAEKRAEKLKAKEAKAADKEEQVNWTDSFFLLSRSVRLTFLSFCSVGSIVKIGKRRKS